MPQRGNRVETTFFTEDETALDRDWLAKSGRRAGCPVWSWSSARALIAGRDDAVANAAPVREQVGDFQQLLGANFAEEAAYGLPRRAWQ